MEDDESESNKPPTVNRGVGSELINEKPVRDSTSSDLDSDSFSRSPSKSMKKIKQDVQMIIDIMGPHTPKSSNNDADNEESVYSNSRLTGMESGARNPDPPSARDEATDISLQEDPTDVSMAVEKSTTTTVSVTNTTSDQDVMPTCHCNKSRSPTRNFSPAPASIGFSDYICPPPLLPANVCLNSECMCPQVASYLHQKHGHVFDPCEETGMEPLPKCRRGSFVDWVRSVISPTSKDTNNKPNQNSEFYKMNMKRCRNDDHSPPRKFVFELVKEEPYNTKQKASEYVVSTKQKDRPSIHTIQECKNEKCLAFEPEPYVHTYVNHDKQFSQKKTNMPSKENCCVDCTTNDKSEVFRTESKLPPESCRSGETDRKKFAGHTTYYDTLEKTKVDVYYFDHGNSRYYKTTDRAPLIVTEDVAEKTQGGATKFWAEIFGVVHVGLAFITSFILQLIRFVLYGILRPLTIGLLQLVSDYFIKPFLATCFNAVIQPILIFVYNVCTSLRDICDPIAEAIGYFFRECAVLIGAFRLVEVRKECCSLDDSGCGRTDYRKQRTRR